MVTPDSNFHVRNLIIGITNNHFHSQNYVVQICSLLRGIQKHAPLKINELRDGMNKTTM